MPVLLKDDMKKFHTLDILNLSKKDLKSIKPELLKILNESLVSLNFCKNKLIEFHNEPLISPIFYDVTKYLKEI